MLVLIQSAAWAGETVVGGVVRDQLSFDPSRDFAKEDFLTNSIYARAFASGEIGTSRWFIEGRFQNHITMRDLNVTPKLDPHFEGWWEAGLGETGWDARLSNAVDLRAGALIESWGRLTLLSVNDILSPHDIRAGVLTPPEFMRLPQPTAVLGVHGGKVRAETMVIPFTASDRLFLQGTNWSPVRQEFTPDLIGEMQTWLDPTGENTPTTLEILDSLQSVTLDIDPSLRRGIDAALLSSNLPQALWLNGSITERIKLTLPSLDLAVYGGNIRQTQPLTSLNPELVNILQTETLPSEQDELSALQEEVLGNAATFEWPRTWIAGIDGSTLVGPVQISAEVLWRQRHIVRRQYLQGSTVPSVSAGLGLLYVPSSKVQVIGEARLTHLFDPPDDLLLAKPDQVQVAGMLRWTLLRDRLTLTTGGLIDLSFMEMAAAGPAVTYRVSDHVQLDLGGSFLVGKTPAPTGLLGDADPALNVMTYAGGPISFFQQNDSVMLAVQFIQ